MNISYKKIKKQIFSKKIILTSIILSIMFFIF